QLCVVCRKTCYHSNICRLHHFFLSEYGNRSNPCDLPDFFDDFYNEPPCSELKITRLASSWNLRYNWRRLSSPLTTKFSTKTTILTCINSLTIRIHILL